MATTPAFASTPHAASALITGTETNLQVPTAAVTVFTAGANGSKIEEVVTEATATSLAATTVAGLIYLFLYDGSTYHLFDAVAITAITSSATAAPFRASNRYTNMILQNGWSLRAANSTASNASVLKVTALGADF